MRRPARIIQIETDSEWRGARFLPATASRQGRRGHPPVPGGATSAGTFPPPSPHRTGAGRVVSIARTHRASVIAAIPTAHPLPGSAMRSRSVLYVLLQVLRSVTLRCPHCRRAGMLRHPYAAHERCPACGLAFQRDEGDFWGAVVFSYAYAGIVGLAVAALLAHAGMERWEAIAYVAAGATVATVLVVFPFAKAQWITLLYFTRGHYEEYRPPQGL